MKQKISIVLFVALLSFAMFRTAGASPAFTQSDSSDFPAGTTIHVDASNTGGMENGTSTYPYDTIQEGIDAAGLDDLVGVAPGIYYERVVLKAGVALVATDPTTTIIDGGGSGIVVSMGDGSLLTGFTIQNGSGSFGAGVVTSGSPTIRNNIIQNNAQTAGGAGAAIFGNVSSPLIANNIIRGNTADNQWLSGAISFINASSPFIVNNIITGNTGRGAINLTVPEGNHPTVVNNTIVDNIGAGIKIDSHVAQLGILVADNIVMGNSTGILIDSLSSAYWPRFEFNDVYGNSKNYDGMPDRTGVDGNISVDPLFSAAFHLSPGSPLIDAGSVNYFPGYDFDGDSRPLDGNGDGVAISDIGADELAFADDTAPVIGATALKADGTEYVADTWTNQTVTVSYTCSDSGSGIATCPPAEVFSADGITPLTTGTAIDNAGNSAAASFGPIKIDKTPPVFLVSVSPNPVLLNGAADLIANASDTLSGIKPGSMPCQNIDSSTVGVKSAQCWVMDNAGNRTNAAAGYQVIYDFEGFLAPLIDCVNNSCSSYQISSYSAGSTISVKFRLRDANGNIVLPTNAPLWLAPQQIQATPPVTFPDGYSFPVTGIPYSWKKSQNMFIYDWSTRRLPSRTIWLVGARLDDGMSYYVFVALK